MGSLTHNFLPNTVTFAQTSLNLILLPVMGYNYLPSSNFIYIGVQVEVTFFILSGTILKSLFTRILMSEIVMWKLALKMGMNPQKSKWLASLLVSPMLKQDL